MKRIFLFISAVFLSSFMLISTQSIFAATSNSSVCSSYITKYKQGYENFTTLSQKLSDANTTFINAPGPNNAEAIVKILKEINGSNNITGMMSMLALYASQNCVG